MVWGWVFRGPLNPLKLYGRLCVEVQFSAGRSIGFYQLIKGVYDLKNVKRHGPGVLQIGDQMCIAVNILGCDGDSAKSRSQS